MLFDFLIWYLSRSVVGLLVVVAMALGIFAIVALVALVTTYPWLWLVILAAIGLPLLGYLFTE